ncbi:MAG: hypothetical protein HUJ98_06585, partial [Bacteroidaceae bacterium]|nr:hypothetical protein [Bacteroidaceae bacterium]
MLAMLVPLSIGFTASAQSTGGNQEEPTNTEAWEFVSTDEFKAAAKIAEGATGGYARGDLFILKLKNNFFPENYGAYSSTDRKDTEFQYSYLESKAGNNWQGKYSEYLYENSVAEVYKLTKYLNAQAHLRLHRTKESTAGSPGTDQEKKAGKLYAFKGNLSRFFFLERDKTLANTEAGTNNKYYNPFKRPTSGNRVTHGDHLVPDNGFLDYGVDAADIAWGQQTGRATTQDWETAFTTYPDHVLNTFLTSTGKMTAYNDYNCLGFTHDCSAGIMRSHMMHVAKPQITVYQTGKTGNARFTEFKAENFTETGPHTILIFVPNKPSDTDKLDWKLKRDESGNSEIRGDYMPYMQYYLAAFDQTGTYASPVTEEDESQRHNLLWFTNVHDKLCGADYTATTRTYLSQNETYTIYTRRETDPEDAWVLTEVFYDLGSAPNEHAFKCNKYWTRETQGYNVVYKLVCKIPYLGVETVTYTTLPVEGLGTTEEQIDLNVISTCNPVDNMSYNGTTDTSLGKNHVTHHLSVILSSKELDASQIMLLGTYTITRNYKDMVNGTLTDQTPQNLTLTISQTESGTREYKWQWNGEGDELDIDYTIANGKITFDWPETHNIDYLYNGYGWDTYSVMFKKEGETAEKTDESDTKIAPFWRTRFETSKSVSEILQDQNPRLYHYGDNSIFDEKTYVVRYSVRIGNEKESVSSGTPTKWKTANYKTEVVAGQAQVPTFIDTDAQTYNPIYCGYIEYGGEESIRGTWCVGVTRTSHSGQEIVAFPLETTKVTPHNQLIAVTMDKESTGGSKTNPIWSYPDPDDEKTTTMQIFPGADFEITAERLPRATTGDYASYDVAFGLNIYDKDGKLVVQQGKQYFQEIVQDIIQEGKGVHIPQFSGREVFNGTSKTSIGTTQNVMYDFTDQTNNPCYYDAFVYYIRPAKKIDGSDDTSARNGQVVAYAHTGAKILTGEIKPADAGTDYQIPGYGTSAYAKLLPKVKGEPVLFENTNGGEKTETGTYKTIAKAAEASPVRAKILYEGNTANRYDGFAYVVLDLEKVIPTKDSNFQPKHETSNSDNLLPAVTSYQIRAYQKDNMDAVDPEEGSSNVKNGLKLFYPSWGDKVKVEEGKPIPEPSYFHITDYDDSSTGDYPAIDGLKPGLHWDTTPTTALHVYADIDKNTTSGYDVNIVEGVQKTPNPTPTTETTPETISETNPATE